MGAVLSKLQDDSAWLKVGAGSAALLAVALKMYLARKGTTMASLLIAGSSWARTAISRNPMMESMVAGGLISYAIYQLQSLYREIVFRIQALFYCSISIRNTDQNYTTVVDFITKFCSQDKTSLQCTTKKVSRTRKDWIKEWNGVADKQIPDMEYRPNRNTVSSFMYKGRRFVLYRAKGSTVTTGYDRRPLEMETLTLTTFGRDNRALKELVTDALKTKVTTDSGKLSIFVLSSGWGGGWELALTKPLRQKTTVVLDSNIAEELLHDAEMFLRSRKWYEDRGIPYRRGYLLYGPPGCGKTSFTQVIAGELRQDVCMLSLSDKGLTDSTLASSLRDAPMNAIILLEDVDAVFVARETKSETHVTFSGLLNAIDGVASQEGRMLFMTTNHIERLDPALIRPGRCDVRVELKKASEMQMESLFLRFFPGDEKRAAEFSRKLPKFELSMAQLQGHLVENRDSAQNALNRIPKLLQATKPQPIERMTVYDHLRRVGLEHYACYFEYHGYQYRDEVAGITIKTVRNWITELAYEPFVASRMERLLKNDKDLLKKQYILAELSTIREAFIATFSYDYQSQHGEAPPLIRRQSSHERLGLVKSRADSNGDVTLLEDAKQPPLKRQSDSPTRYSAKQIERMSKQLCERLSRNGKGIVSVYQLEWLLKIFPHPQRALDNAHILTKPRKKGSGTPPWMTAFQWLKRANMANFASLFETRGKKLARDLIKTKPAELQQYQGINKPLFTVLAGNMPENSNVTIGMSCPDRKRVMNMFRVAYPEATRDTIFAFSKSVTCEFGRGLVSGIQLTAYFAKYKSDEKAAVANATKELVDIPKAPVPKCPPVPPPTDWVYKWLKTFKMEQVAMNFIVQGLRHREDIVVKPILEDEELKTNLGVSKLGWRREIIRRIQCLLDGEDDGVPFTYTPSKTNNAYFAAASAIDSAIETANKGA